MTTTSATISTTANTNHAPTHETSARAAGREDLMSRLGIFGYGLFAYAFGMANIFYLIGFTTGWLVPKDINDGNVGSMSSALIVNTLLVLAFAVQHEIMARPWFKSRITRIMPKAMERSTFVLVASLILSLMFWQWRPMPFEMWSLDGMWSWGIYAIALAGWAIAVGSTFIIDHFDLFGLRQVTLHLKNRPYTTVRFKEWLFYRLCRHPLMLGFIIAFWSTPVMTLGHFWFAMLMTAFILAGVQFEERDLIRAHGRDYESYRERVPGLVPVPAALRRRRMSTAGD